MGTGRPPSNLTGERFGRWVALEYLGGKRWRCRCDCGTEREVLAAMLKSGHSRSCGCLRDELSSVRASRPRLDLTGQRFGRWLVIERSSSSSWRCVCDCGTERMLPTGTLRYGGTQSCGCLRRERALATNTMHGLRDRPVYRTWASMLQRCRNPNAPGYEYYGDRGITVCARWDPQQGGSFSNFLADMGERPEGMSIDRIDNDGNYEPGNCRWATQAQQIANRPKGRRAWSAEARARQGASHRANNAARDESIRREFLAGATASQLAEQYGVLPHRIRRIVKGLPRDRSQTPEHVAKRWATRRANARRAEAV
jgi:hypothetical protein